MKHDLPRLERDPVVFCEHMLTYELAPWQQRLLLWMTTPAAAKALKAYHGAFLLGTRFVTTAMGEVPFSEYLAPFVDEYIRRTGRADAFDIVRDTLAKYGATRFREIDTGTNQVACLKEILTQLTGEKQP